MIEGGKCQCGKNIVPFRRYCPSCGSAMNKADFEENGSILTYTTLYAAPEGFETPIRLAMVELKEGAHLVCSVKGDRDIVIGDDVNVKRDGEMYVCEHVK